jgi:hypothetical protein
MKEIFIKDLEFLLDFLDKVWLEMFHDGRP